ncbi:uncharacterized protein LOC123307035 [Coccinella septempunctata]|uniref:uncharacterized protein LOC123307035 n=1 Tax=Coccinella septempunctata TaxID=41139 RepID=UPI001D0917BB|nr:uncharacterized protein LOC123307035 [Coccinella septempunctata]
MALSAGIIPSEVPSSYHEAISCDEEWKSAIDAELESLVANKTWEIVDKPADAVVIDSSTIYFSYDGTYYRQKEETPMGSRISGIVAEDVTDKILDYAKGRLSCLLPFCRKYIDDVITAIPKELIQQSLEILNSFDPRGTLQSTIEEEANNSLPFLHMRVIREVTTEGSTLLTDWYRKQISSSRYIHYKSYHPMSMKINIILNLKTRVTKPSHKCVNKNLRILLGILGENGYPHEILTRSIFNTGNSIEILQQPGPIAEENEQEQIKQKYISLPYIEELTPLLNKLIPSEKFILATRNVKQLRSFFTKHKDHTSLLQCNGVVYKIPCQNCEAVFIGQTSTFLRQRLSSHRSDNNTKKKSSALAIHAVEEEHQPVFDAVEVLDRERNLEGRLFMEMVRISQEEHSVNSRKDIQNLSIMNSLLIEWDKNQNTRGRVPQGSVDVVG